jgi:hypothetical protein
MNKGNSYTGCLLFTGNDVYRRVNTTMERSKTGDWSLDDEG